MKQNLFEKKLVERMVELDNARLAAINDEIAIGGLAVIAKDRPTPSAETTTSGTTEASPEQITE